jgi:microcystin-dependent protein
MGTPFVGEIRMFAGNFAPAGWQFCNGALMAISENETLFNLIGTTFGGDGQSTFAVPDLQGRVPVHSGTGAGLSSYVLGQTGGTEQVTLTSTQMPAHSHTVRSSGAAGTLATPANAVLANGSSTAVNVYKNPADLATAQVALNPATLASTGGNQPHDNLQPTLTVTYIISLFGVFPSPT